MVVARRKQDIEKGVKPRIFPETGDRLIGRYLSLIGIVIFLLGFVFLGSRSRFLGLAVRSLDLSLRW